MGEGLKFGYWGLELVGSEFWLFGFRIFVFRIFVFRIVGGGGFRILGIGV